ncbi:bifunctional DNA primase/polymerase, partial [Candidatus Poribacteria bacterium]|nr:bifunctional DNA primase/polymerase [Candidatus Poribacteria bacterium]
MDEKRKELLNYANKLVDAGISCTFTKANKASIGTWTELQETPLTKDELRKKARRGNVKGIAVVCGKVSGGLEFLDFDKRLGKTVYPEWKEAVKSQKPELLEKLITDESPSGGYHVGYRYEAEGYDRGQTLAEEWEVDPETKEIRKNQNRTKRKLSLIERKAEGCLVTIPPTPNYKHLQGDLLKPPTISRDDRDFLISVAKSFHTAIAESSVVSDTTRQKKLYNGRLRPGDDFNQRGDWGRNLESDGWTKVFISDGKEHWRHSNAKNTVSANFDPTQGENGLFYVHSSNASPFEVDTA